MSLAEVFSLENKEVTFLMEYSDICLMYSSTSDDGDDGFGDDFDKIESNSVSMCSFLFSGIPI